MTGAVARRPPQAASKWFPEGYYSMHADKALERIGTSANLPTAMCLYFICASRANVWGHAAFMPGEMQDLLGCTEKTRRKALQSLRSAKIAAQESTPLCVVLSAEAWRRGGKATQTCIEPSHVDRQRLMWATDYGWEEQPGEWHELVKQPHSHLLYADRKRRTTTTTTTVVEEEDRVAVRLAQRASWACALLAYRSLCQCRA